MIRTLMTWQPDKSRWRKLYQGTRYYVTCTTLGTPPTKEASYQAANTWWKAKQAEIDARAQLPNSPVAEDIIEYRRRRDWCRSRGDNAGAEHWGALAAGLEADPNAPLTLEHMAGYRLQAIQAMSPEQLAAKSHLFDPVTAVWADRFEQEGAPSVPDDMTIGHQVGRYLELERSRVESDQLSTSEYDLARLCLEAFRDWAGSQMAVGVVDADRWEAYWQHLTGLSMSVEYRKKRFRHARAFLDWLIAKGKLAAIPNLHSRKYRFAGGAKAVPTMTATEVQRLIAEAPGQLRLHLLLMLNTGMTQTDISDLSPTEIDWKHGRVTRARSKTRDQSSNVPVVSYPLWPETWDLLKRYGHRDGEHALLTESGREWVRDTLSAKGKRSKVDSIKSNYVHLAKRLDFKKSMKLLRKSAASMLDNHAEFGRYSLHFLGHSPRGVAAQHYIDPSRERFDAAVKWLGQQYGFIPPDPPKKKPGRKP